MAHWLIQLDGDPFDLEEFPYWFPDGDIFAIAEQGRVYLTGPAFEAYQDAGQVHEAAIRALDEFSAIVALLWPSLRKPSVGKVYRVGDDEKRQGFVFGSFSAKVRSKTRATLRVNSETPEHQAPTQAQQLLAACRRDRHLQVAALLWADPARSWPRLYRILEEIEHHLGQPVHKAGFCSENQRERFTRSANAAEVSGKDARHALGKFVPPNKPMSLQEAASFVGQLLVTTLRRLV